MKSVDCQIKVTDGLKLNVCECFKDDLSGDVR